MQQQAPQQIKPVIKHKKATDFDGVLEMYYDPREEIKADTTPIQIVGLTRKELQKHKDAMNNRHKQEVEAMEKVFAVLDPKEEKTEVKLEAVTNEVK